MTKEEKELNERIAKIKDVYPTISKVAIASICVFLCLPVFIFASYYIGDCGFILIDTSLTLGSALEFYGAFLVFMGTVALGLLALWQNRKAVEINNRLLQLEEVKQKLEVQPFVMICDWNAEPYGIGNIMNSSQEIHVEICELPMGTYFYRLRLTFINTTNNFLTAQYSKATIRNLDDNENIVGTWKAGTINTLNPKLHLNNGEKGAIFFCASYEDFESFISKRITIELILENKLSQLYQENFDIIIPIFQRNGNVTMFTQDYKIGKMVKDENGETVVKWEEQ